ncbi:unnamed protein product, partial [marine sediment metagenome]
ASVAVEPLFLSVVKAVVTTVATMQKEEHAVISY